MRCESGDEFDFDDDKINAIDYMHEEDDFLDKVGEDEMTLFSLNIRGLSNKISLLESFLKSVNKKNKTVDIIFLCETFIREGEEKFCNLSGYNSFHFPRSKRLGGGIAFFINKIIDVDKVEKIERDENQFLILNLKNLNLQLCGIYHPPHTKVNEFLKEYDSILSKKSNMLCMGDFNIDVLKRNTAIFETLASNSYSILNQIGN